MSLKLIKLNYHLISSLNASLSKKNYLISNSILTSTKDYTKNNLTISLVEYNPKGFIIHLKKPLFLDSFNKNLIHQNIQSQKH